jgi:hypothetical protein
MTSQVTLIVNAGSRVASSGGGWTNTYQAARAEAERWLERMHAEGMTDVVLLDDAEEAGGCWRFTYRHTVTGVSVRLETPGIDDLAAYQKEHIFPPRIYWNGSSSGNPQLDDFAAPGFAPVRTFRQESRQ